MAVAGIIAYRQQPGEIRANSPGGYLIHQRQTSHAVRYGIVLFANPSSCYKKI
jgi:hypothetical protein